MIRNAAPCLLPQHRPVIGVLRVRDCAKSLLCRSARFQARSGHQNPTSHALQRAPQGRRRLTALTRPNAEFVESQRVYFLAACTQQRHVRSSSRSALLQHAGAMLPPYCAPCRPRLTHIYLQLLSAGVSEYVRTTSCGQQNVTYYLHTIPSVFFSNYTRTGRLVVSHDEAQRRNKSHRSASASLFIIFIENEAGACFHEDDDGNNTIIPMLASSSSFNNIYVCDIGVCSDLIKQLRHQRKDMKFSGKWKWCVSASEVL